MKTGISLRRAELSDAKLLFSWRNDPSVRANSFNREELAYDSHLSWLKNVLSDPERDLYIVMDGEEPAGQIRLDVSGTSAVISYSIDAEKRGKGYGKAAVRLAEEAVKKTRPRVRRLIAEVLPGNERSSHVFLSLGFQEEETPSFFKYVKEL